MSTELVIGTVTPIVEVPVSVLEDFESRLAFCETLCRRLTIQQTERKSEPMKSYHWVTVAVVLIVAYLIGVKYPSIGQSALGKVGLA